MYKRQGGKRAQRKLLGPMRSLNWTDHANMTKQQAIPLADIDIKLLRWVSEIVADGSEIRSLAGRSARLGDGTSRNPKDREALLDQRTKDLAGMIGQVRGFDLNEFLSDWEQADAAVPWGIGDQAWVEAAAPKSKQKSTRGSVPSPVPAAPAGALSAVMSSEGVSPTLKVLYVPDYVPSEQRIAATSKLYVELSLSLIHI